MQVSIVPMIPEHGEAVLDIFEQGIETANATFETQAPDTSAWDARFLSACRLVAMTDGRVVGWAALSPISQRRVYSGVAEVSVYIESARHGQGIGSLLLSRLIEESERNGFWTLQAGMFPENEASVALHKRHGFRIVGLRERVGQMHGLWRDVLLMERRSPVVGSGSG
ncbi:MAG: N-acetyltransferase family protein [Candidatus Palauibacterales bacterium]|nr:N-acetyltransferase family protein [Candidatus Palauibacterales bacterium]